MLRELSSETKFAFSDIIPRKDEATFKKDYKDTDVCMKTFGEQVILVTAILQKTTLKKLHVNFIEFYRELKQKLKFY